MWEIGKYGTPRIEALLSINARLRTLTDGGGDRGKRWGQELGRNPRGGQVRERSMRLFHVAVLSGAIVLVPVAAVSKTRAELRSCAELYAQRNAIHRAKMPLSDRDRHRIAEIRRTERARGCREH